MLSSVVCQMAKQNQGLMTLYRLRGAHLIHGFSGTFSKTQIEVAITGQG